MCWDLMASHTGRLMLVSEGISRRMRVGLKNVTLDNFDGGSETPADVLLLVALLDVGVAIFNVILNLFVLLVC